MNQNPLTGRSECLQHGLAHRAVKTGQLSLIAPVHPFAAAKRIARAVAMHGPGKGKFRTRQLCAALREGLRG